MITSYRLVWSGHQSLGFSHASVSFRTCSCPAASRATAGAKIFLGSAAGRGNNLVADLNDLLGGGRVPQGHLQGKLFLLDGWLGKDIGGVGCAGGDKAGGDWRIPAGCTQP